MRIALFHSELSRDGPGLLLRDILSGKDEQVEASVRVLKAANADILVLADFDYDLNGTALAAFADRLENYPYRLALASNRGRPSGADLDGNGRISGAKDAVGHGDFQGQGALALLSRLPFDHDLVRDFNDMPWRALPGNLALPETPDTFPFSTTGHWDIPVTLTDGTKLHILTWHATPPVFDGPEDRNGRRNHDESAFWIEYLDGTFNTAPPAHFVLAGVANLDPIDGDGRPAALNALMSHPLVQRTRPQSRGGAEAAQRDGQINDRHRGDPAFDTADWPDQPGRPGNLRVDYVLPATSLSVAGTGVFWPLPDTSLGRDVNRASRHRLVWLDIEVAKRARDGG